MPTILLSGGASGRKEVISSPNPPYDQRIQSAKTGRIQNDAIKNIAARKMSWDNRHLIASSC